MDVQIERRLLQVAIAVGSLVPVLGGGAGMIFGPDPGSTLGGAIPINLDSHFRYLSGLLCGIGFGFLSCIAQVETQGRRFQLLGALVLLGGAGRAWGIIDAGLPGIEHRLALGMELGVTPLLMLWQARLARRWRQAQPTAGSAESQGAAGR